VQENGPGLIKKRNDRVYPATGGRNGFLR